MKAKTRLATTLLLALILFGRATVSWSAPETPPKMKPYFLALLYKGPAWTPEVTPESTRIQEGHMANIRRLERLVFRTDSQGAVTSLVFRQQGQEYVASPLSLERN